MKLHIGSGSNFLAGYTNVDRGNFHEAARLIGADFVQCDLLKIDECFPYLYAEEVYSEFVFEHFSPGQVKTLLFLLSRILIPTGRLYIVVPDFYSLLREWEPKFDTGDFSNLDVFNTRVFSDPTCGVHQSVWTESIGRWFLENEGLYTVKSCLRYTLRGEPVLSFLAERMA